MVAARAAAAARAEAAARSKMSVHESRAEDRETDPWIPVVQHAGDVTHETATPRRPAVAASAPMKTCKSMIARWDDGTDEDAMHRAFASWHRLGLSKGFRRALM